MPRALPKYIIELKKGKDTVTSAPLTRVRLAIRFGRANLRGSLPGTQLTVRGWQPGDASKRGRVEYQAHLGADGKIIVAEER